MNISLSDWAKQQELTYLQAHRKFSNGELPGAFKENGHIKVKIEDPQPVIQVIDSSQPNTSKIPTINYAFADTISTRSNKSSVSPIINRFANIDEGLIPYMSSTAGGYNRSGIVVRDTIILCQKAYFNIAIFRQIIDLIVDLSIGEIQFKGGNKKSRDFFNAYCKKVGINGLFQGQFFLELWRGANVFTFAYEKDISKDDVAKITNVYGLEAKAAKKVTLPAKFTILNPADIQVSAYSMFINPEYFKILSGYELERLKDPKNDTDQEVFDSLPADAQKEIKKGTGNVTIILPAKNLLACFYKKQDYEGLAVPVFFPVLDDLNWKLELKKMDIATTRMMNQAILLVTTGAEPDKGGINQNNITNLQAIFMNQSVGRVLVADYTTKAQFIIPEISSVLDPKKYEAVNNDIYIGLNYILLQGEKFANKQTALQLFVEKIKYGRKIFIDEFLNNIIEKVSKELGFKNYPTAYFEDIAIEKAIDRDRIIAQLAQYGHLTPEETFEALKTGRLPLPDETVEDQAAYKTLRDKGYYQPVVGGPAAQLQLSKETGKQAMDLQTNKQEHDAKEGAKQRKHDAANPPPAPPPAIHVNAPTTLKKPNGRPTGTGTPQKTKRIRPLGASLISGTAVIKNILLADKLNKTIIDHLLKKHNLTALTAQQLEIAKGIGEVITRNEEPENWEISIEKYIEKPIDTNLERIDDIEELAAYHGLETSLAALVLPSLKEENVDK